MTGILLVLLVVFASQEGNDVLDNKFKEERASEWLHLFEMILLFENFLNSEEHTRKSIEGLKGFIPVLLNTYKNRLSRTEGMGMKIIKFNLPLHFPDDIIRFGSMKNFDTGIGESHHRSEARKPVNLEELLKHMKSVLSNSNVQNSERQENNLGHTYR